MRITLIAGTVDARPEVVIRMAPQRRAAPTGRGRPARARTKRPETDGRGPPEKAPERQEPGAPLTAPHTPGGPHERTTIAS